MGRHVGSEQCTRPDQSTAPVAPPERTSRTQTRHYRLHDSRFAMHYPSLFLCDAAHLVVGNLESTESEAVDVDLELAADGVRIVSGGREVGSMPTVARLPSRCDPCSPSSRSSGAAACAPCLPGRLPRLSPYPESDRGKLDEGEVIGSELVVTGGDTPALLDLKEPVDQVTYAVEIGAEVDGARAIFLRRYDCLIQLAS